MYVNDIARLRAEGAQPIIERIRELVGDPYASVTIALEDDAWNFDTREGAAAYHAEMLDRAGLDWEGIEIADTDRGIGWLHGPGTYAHSGDQRLYAYAVDAEAVEELQQLLYMLNNPEVAP